MMLTMLEASSKVNVETPTKPRIFSKLSPTSLVYWLRFGSGILAGILYNALAQTTGLKGVEIGTLALISVGITVYALTVFIVKYVLNYGPTELKGPNKHVSIGMGSFIIWMIFTTMVIYTILNGPRLSGPS